MRVKRRIVSALVVVASIGAVSFATAGAAPRDQLGKHFTLTARQVKSQPGYQHNPLALPNSQDSPGDTFLDQQDLFHRGEKVGTGSIVCTEGLDRMALCRAVYSINGQGKLMLAGQAGPSNDLYVAVTGGTEAFRGAHGDNHIVNTSDTESRLTINLV